MRANTGRPASWPAAVSGTSAASHTASGTAPAVPVSASAAPAAPANPTNDVVSVSRTAWGGRPRRIISSTTGGPPVVVDVLSAPEETPARGRAHHASGAGADVPAG